MIAFAQVTTPESLIRLHGIWEHAYYIDSTIIVHYSVDGTRHQDIYIGKIWSEVKPHVEVLFPVVDAPIDIVVVNAAIVDVVTPVDEEDEDEFDPLKY